MPHLCPRPCSRLATAAVFISVGVVQFVVGIILLRSKYVFLLAGPDFWTSACNITVGCLLGVAASVWKNSTKLRSSKKHIIRRNLLLSLLFSALILNATTLGIFLLGEGNALLSIRLENGKKYDEATFASEVLAYAYVTSVCCPIVCIVVNIVSMSGSCFKHAAVKKKYLGTKTVVNTGRTEPLRYVYTPDLAKSKKKVPVYMPSSSSDSLSDDDEKDVSSYLKYSNSSEDVRDVLTRMANGKRESMLSDSAVMLREMDVRRKNKYDSYDRDGSYVGPILQRARESILGERQPIEQAMSRAQLSQTKVKKPIRNFTYFSGNTGLPSDVNMKRIMYSKSKQLHSLYKSPYSSQQLVDEYQDASLKMKKHYPSQYKKFRQRFRSASDISDRGMIEFAGRPKKPKRTEVEMEVMDAQSKYSNKRKMKSVRVRDKDESESFEETSPTCFSPDGSDFESDSIFEKSRRSSWAGEIVPISIKHSSGLKLSHKLIPVANPVVPGFPQTHDAPKISDDSGLGSVGSNTFNEVSKCDYKSKQSLSSFQEDKAVRNDTLEFPRIGSQSAKKYDMKLVKMTSISEESNVESNNKTKEMLEKYDSEDDTDLKSWRSYTGKPSPLRFESSDDKVNARRGTTIKRKASASGKALRKIWSLGTSERKTDFRDQVVDEDSLIGLSEEELIERQLRTRSIRRVVQQRMREKVGL